MSEPTASAAGAAMPAEGDKTRRAALRFLARSTAHKPRRSRSCQSPHSPRRTARTPRSSHSAPRSSEDQE